MLNLKSEFLTPARLRIRSCSLSVGILTRGAPPPPDPPGGEPAARRAGGRGTIDGQFPRPLPGAGGRAGGGGGALSINCPPPARRAEGPPRGVRWGGNPPGLKCLQAVDVSKFIHIHLSASVRSHFGSRPGNTTPRQHEAPPLGSGPLGGHVSGPSSGSWAAFHVPASGHQSLGGDRSLGGPVPPPGL